MVVTTFLYMHIEWYEKAKAENIRLRLKTEQFLRKKDPKYENESCRTREYRKHPEEEEGDGSPPRDGLVTTLSTTIAHYHNLRLRFHRRRSVTSSSPSSLGGYLVSTGPRLAAPPRPRLLFLPLLAFSFSFSPMLPVVLPIFPPSYPPRRDDDQTSAR